MIFVPLLHYLKNKNAFSGNEDAMRYQLTPGKRTVPDPEKGGDATREEAILTVDVWPEPWTLEFTDPALRRQKVFPLTEEGRAEAAEYLSSTYSADTAYWKQRPSILDSEPWSPPKDEEAESEGDK